MREMSNLFKNLFVFVFSIWFVFKFFLTSIFDDEMRKLFLIAVLIFGIIYIGYSLYKLYKRKHLDNEYIRQIPNFYSVPMVAYLYDTNIKLKPVLTATILKLYDLGIITIQKEINRTIYIKNNNININKLSGSEKYILDWLTDFNKSKYSSTKLQQIFNKELQEHKFVTRKLFLFPIMMIFTLVFLAMGGYITEDAYVYLLGFSFVLGLVSIFISPMAPKLCYSFNTKYSKKGRNEHYNVLGFYNFLKDFSLLNEVEMKEYPLWKEYLQYAVLFGINNNYILNETLNFMTDEEFINFLTRD